MGEVMYQHPQTAGTSTARNPATGNVPRKNGTPGKPLRILLVEDSPLLRGRLENMISQHAAFKVTGLAAAESEAIEKLDSVAYDVIVWTWSCAPAAASASSARRVRAIRTRATARTCGSSC